MATHFTTARPYAKAVFADAQDNKLLTPWSQVMQALAVIAEDKRIQQVSMDPNVSDQETTQLFCDVVKTLLAAPAAALGDRLKNFIALLIHEDRLLILPDIAELFHQLLMKHQGVIEAEVISAFPLSEDHREQLISALESRFKSKIQLKVTKDESLVGGALVRAGNWVMNGSIKGKLAALADSLGRV